MNRLNVILTIDGEKKHYYSSESGTGDEKIKEINNKLKKDNIDFKLVNPNNMEQTYTPLSEIFETDIITKDFLNGDCYYVTSNENGILKGQKIGSVDNPIELLEGDWYKVLNANGEYDDPTT